VWLRFSSHRYTGIYETSCFISRPAAGRSRHRGSTSGARSVAGRPSHRPRADCQGGGRPAFAADHRALPRARNPATLRAARRARPRDAQRHPSGCGGIWRGASISGAHGDPIRSGAGGGSRRHRGSSQPRRDHPHRACRRSRGDHGPRAPCAGFDRNGRESCRGSARAPSCCPHRQRQPDAGEPQVARILDLWAGRTGRRALFGRRLRAPHRASAWIRKRCDFIVRIPMAGAISSLNVSVAAGVVLFEWRRKRSISA